MTAWLLALGLMFGASCLPAMKSAGAATDADELARDLPSEDAIRRVVAETYEGGDLQTELPPERDLELTPVDWLEIPDIVLQILRYAMWGLMIVGGIMIIAYLANEVPGWIQGRAKRTAAATQRGVSIGVAEVQALRDALAEADRLAAAGNCAEALHLLLLHSFDYLRRQLGFALAPALTSREVLGRSGLPDMARSALGAIVSAVEISYFGGRSVDAGVYGACRAHYERFVEGGVAMTAPSAP